MPSTPKTIARGQISIVDISDGKTMNFYLTANRPLTQLYNLDNMQFTPNYATENLVITPELYVSGSSANQMTAVIGGSSVVTDVEYTINGTVVLNNANRTNAALGATYNPAGHTLTFTKNLAAAYMTITCTCAYADPETQAVTNAKAGINFNKIDTTGSTIIAVMSYPLGLTIKNGEPDHVVLHCDVWRGSEIDNSDIRYIWYRRDNRSGSGADTENWYIIGNGGSDVTKDIRGRLVTDSTPSPSWSFSSFADDATAHLKTTGGVNEIYIPKDAIDNYDVFKCVCYDTDGSSGTGTQGGTVIGQFVYDTATVIDQTDPYMIQFTTSAGTILKDGNARTVVTADIWQNARLIEVSSIPAGVTGWQFTWTKRNRDGSIDQNWRPAKSDSSNVASDNPERWNSCTGDKTTHRSILVVRSEVTVSALYSLEITIPQ